MLPRHLNNLPWALLALLLLAALKLQLTNAAGDESASTESNEIIPREAIQKLDYSVRQALLRAIDKLEQEEAAAATLTVTETINEEEPSTTDATTLSTQAAQKRDKDEILEESNNAADVVVPTVQFYTATFDERNAQEQLLSSFIDRSKLLKKTTLKKQNPTVPLPLEAKIDEELPDNRQLTRSVGSAVRTNEISNHDGSNEIKFEIRNAKKESTTSTTSTTTTTTTTTTPKPRTTRRRTTTTTTTTTSTTPRPTHNEDGENIELVDKEDIRIQEAPLVTAFTVDLDERGSAHKFRPLVHSAINYKQLGLAPIVSHVGPTITKLNVLQETDSPATPNPTQASTTSTTQQASTTGFSTAPNFQSSTSQYLKQDALPDQPAAPIASNYLIERQRALEQQIYQLKLQAQQQQDLILRQLRLLAEQTRYNAAPIAQFSTLQPQQQQQQPEQQQQQQQQHTLEAIQALQPPPPGYTIRPSVEFIPSTHTKTIVYPTYPIEQQLPLRDAVAGNKFGQHNGNSNNNNNINNNNINNNNNNNNNNYQKLPTTSAVQQIFHNLQQNLQKAAENSAATTGQNVQIQPSSQFNFAPALSPPALPLEAAAAQALPQHSFQQFQQQQQQQLQPTSQLSLPAYVTNAIYQQQQQQQQQHRARLFRQESGTGNFGLNTNVEIQPSNSFDALLPPSIVNSQQQQTLENQNFYRQHLTPQLSSRLQQNAQQYLQQQQQLLQQQQQLQQQQKTTESNGNGLEPTLSSALNHGIPQFASQNLHYNVGGGNSF